jgi:hypothetical protein
LKAHDATLNAFYVSNVESYLNRNGVWPAFCANVATMPLDESSVFIRPSGFLMSATSLETPHLVVSAGVALIRQPDGTSRLQAMTRREPLMSIAQEVAANNCAGK